MVFIHSEVRSIVIENQYGTIPPSLAEIMSSIQTTSKNLWRVQPKRTLVSDHYETVESPQINHSPSHHFGLMELAEHFVTTSHISK